MAVLYCWEDKLEFTKEETNNIRMLVKTKKKRDKIRRLSHTVYDQYNPFDLAVISPYTIL